MFWLNMEKALPTDYCGYVAGYGIPDQMASAHGSGDTVTINMKTPVNENWFLYNMLSSITPMPDSWDVTAPGKSSTCATGVWGSKATDAACSAVYNYLNASSVVQANASNAMWQSGDSGPWTLTHFDSLGNVSYVPNTKYSGPQKAQVAKVVEIPYASASAEQTALRLGTVDLGYVDNTILTANGSVAKPGANWSPIAGKYNLEVGAPWSVDYAAYNFNPKYAGSSYLDQFYVRQALQDTVNQPLIINKVFKGYGYVTNNPMPPAAPASLTGNASNKVRYPYSPSAASSLLSAHGWSRVGGVQTCVRAGTASNDCGAGIKKGQALKLSMEYESGSPSIQIEVAAEVSEWKSIGINVTTTSAPFNLIIGNCISKPSTWGICFWGAGWIYSPDYYPSGESLFVPGASFNIGLYSNPTLTAAVKSTTFGSASLAQFSNLAAYDLPVLYQPNQTDAYSGAGIGEVLKTLKSVNGFTPNSLTNFMPEYFHF
jgi:peptide/nickel transport system substrate-binding protein